MLRERIVRINDILDQVNAYFREADLALIEKAYVFSAKVHHGQTRLSGEPYLNHPMSVARILADLRLDEYSIATGLLHDTVEDTYATIEEIDHLFGHEVATLVDGVTKISKISFESQLDQQAENFRKIILAMSKDIRVILIKLADRLHNMRTLIYLPLEKQRQLAQETLDIYAPLAGRLGIFLIKSELEDLCLSYLRNEAYAEIKEKLVVTSAEREKYVSEVVRIIDEKLRQFGIGARVVGRPKHAYSIYNKMFLQNLDFSQIYDIIAFRVIVNSRRDCYEVLGSIHSIWTPVPGRFKDYISMPKANRYQSLHTTVIGPYGQRIEIQIRTEEMNRIAEQGIAAHWKYKEGRKIDQKDDQRFAWLNQLMEWQKELKDPREFLETVRIDLFPHEVYVFTPKGAVLEFPAGSTPVDFAYRIHSEIGHRCVGAKINGKLVPLKYLLKSGNVVEIVTLPNHHPSKDWLKFVKTSRAKTKIKQWIRSQERETSIGIGRDVCEREFSKHSLNFTKLLRTGEILKVVQREGIKDIDDFLEAVGRGEIKAKHVLNKLLPKEMQTERVQESRGIPLPRTSDNKGPAGVRIRGIDDIMIRFGKCCSPLPGEKIIGYITRGRGMTVHAADCPYLGTVDAERKLEAEWDPSYQNNTPVSIEVLCVDQKGLLADITSSIASAEANIRNARVSTTSDRKAINVFEIEVTDLNHLNTVIRAIAKLRGVLNVSRIRF
ncbi:MAG: bifunctional (p)ppGpp synthetase/guanosine-3',5'-bis(diphosphate) 3'-pyrophosphohydrolase [Proteobacteria bacterium]|nr:bifunctional (p)ppGpp synthetase/guanosine-3',5'-bis(diphosphate) 3'-pyrophosphohydrolase [Pseudomonadota bacterium]